MQIRCSNCFFQYEQDYGLCPNCGYAEGEQYSEAYSLQPGTSIKDNRYIIGEVLGLGGFGITYKAWDRQLETVIAIKEYFPSGLVNRTSGCKDVFLVASKREREFSYGKRRFLDEARNMAKFSKHHNIVNVFNYFEENNTAYIIMEYLDGLTLGQALQVRQEPLPADRCVSIAIDVCDALESIHKEKILHRDVSPDNIMLCKDGTVKLFDFGAARFSADGTDESKVTVIVKPGFAPPEQYDRVNQQDERTDLYALGATLYYAITGHKPEESTDRKVKDTLQPPVTLVPGIPEYINNAIMRAMAVDPQYRFKDVDEFRRILQQRIKVATISNERKKRARRRFIGIGAAVLAVIAAGATAWLLWQNRTNHAVLPDGRIELWYMTTGDPVADKTEEDAFRAVADRFMDEHDNVLVSVMGVPQDQYENKLAEAAAKGKMPEIYESTGMDPERLADAESLQTLLEESSGNVYLGALDENQKQYPTGLVVPVIYVNTSIGSVEETRDVTQMANLCQEFNSTLLVSEEAFPLYREIYGTEIDKYAAKDAKQKFLTGKSLMYLGTTADYLQVQEGMMRTGLGTYSVYMPGADRIAYEYGCLWSCGAQEEASMKISRAMLIYLNTDFGQDYFNIRNFSQSGNVPVTNSALKTYLESYEELSEINLYLEKGQ